MMKRAAKSPGKPRPRRVRRARVLARRDPATAIRSTTRGGDTLSIHPATPDRWTDLEKLFGAQGACAGCWCMWWRLPHAQWQAQKGQANRQTLCELVTSGTVPGLIAYRGSIPVGWCAVAPRADFPRLATSRILKPVDEERVWSIPCLFVDRAHRRTGVSKALLVAAREFAAKRGARVVEGYPVDTGGRRKPDVFVFTGLFEAFQAAGFAEVARRSAFRPVVRWYK